jgi:hypothetical protein
MIPKNITAFTIDVLATTSSPIQDYERFFIKVLPMSSSPQPKELNEESGIRRE